MSVSFKYGQDKPKKPILQISYFQLMKTISTTTILITFIIYYMFYFLRVES